MIGSPGCGYRRGWVRRSNREDYCLSCGDQKGRDCGVGLDIKLPRLRTGDDGTPVAVKEGFVPTHQVVSR